MFVFPNNLIYTHFKIKILKKYAGLLDLQKYDFSWTIINKFYKII